MRKAIESVPVSSDHLSRKPSRALHHLPGPKGHWLTGNTRQLLPNPRPFLQAMQVRHGNCFTVGFLRNRRAVMLIGPQANERLLLDHENNFSSRWGWEVVHAFFGRNILVRDFEDHRVHRKLMTGAFKSQVMARYLEQMHPIIRSATHKYVGRVDVYAQTKQMALDIAIRVFAGIAADDDVVAWNKDLSTVLSNVMAQRIRLPGSRYHRAIRARDRLRVRLLEELRTRRGSSANDLFTQLSNQSDGQGRALSDQDVIDHVFGLLFAAHDTTASSLAMMFWLLAEYPEWQCKAREECIALYEQTGSSDLSYEQSDALPIIEAVFKEALRLYAPIQFIPRRSVNAFEFEGLEIPANTSILLSPQLTHYDRDYFAQPERFDPQRFLDASVNPPPFTFVPFGKGSHMCLGMRFAHMEVKAVLYHMLLNRRLEREDGQQLSLEYMPLVRPQREMCVQFGDLAVG